MATTAILMNEIEKLPDDFVAEVLDFVLFLRTRKPVAKLEKTKVESMYGAFPGLDPSFEREEEDRV